MTVKDLESAVKRLEPDELTEFRSWFEGFSARAWDRQFEADAAVGRLDSIADRALKDLANGKCTTL